MGVLQTWPSLLDSRPHTLPTAAGTGPLVGVVVSVGPMGKTAPGIGPRLDSQS